MTSTQAPDAPDSVVPPAREPTLLRTLVTELHWQKFTTFERQFSHSARQLAKQTGEPELATATVSPRQFERWYSGQVKTSPHPDACRILEYMFGQPVQHLLAPAPAQRHSEIAGVEDAASLTEWLTATSVSDEAVSQLDRAEARLAAKHALTAPATLLTEARQVHATAQALLTAGRIRHRQERELLRINGSVLAHMALLTSDLGDDTTGEEYASAALLYLREAAASEAPAWYVLAKIARWRHQYTQAADLAHQGLQHVADHAMRTQLACYEANTAALAGDRCRAAGAMKLAEETWAVLPPGQMTLSPWSFSGERIATFRVSVALATANPAEALTAAAAWEDGQRQGRPCIRAAWAQIRVGAAIARLSMGELDGAAQEAAPVLALPPEFRITTVTGWLADLKGRISVGPYDRSPAAASLREQIRDFHRHSPAATGTPIYQTVGAPLTRGGNWL
jgi:hypothetical protein